MLQLFFNLLMFYFQNSRAASLRESICQLLAQIPKDNPKFFRETYLKLSKQSVSSEKRQEFKIRTNNFVSERFVDEKDCLAPMKVEVPINYPTTSSKIAKTRRKKRRRKKLNTMSTTSQTTSSRYVCRVG